jgi:hypothetical protein
METADIRMLIWAFQHNEALPTTSNIIREYKTQHIRHQGATRDFQRNSNPISAHNTQCWRSHFPFLAYFNGKWHLIFLQSTIYSLNYASYENIIDCNNKQYAKPFKAL